MKKVYESTGNIHIPELKCSAQKGTRMIVDDEERTFTMNGVTVPLMQDFQILLKYNLVRELSKEEIETPEKVIDQPISRLSERKKMKVEIAEDNKVEIKTARKHDEATVEETNEENDEPMIRGMKVITDDSIPIAKSLEKASEEIVESSIGKNEKPRPTPKPKKTSLSDDEKKKVAEKLKAERVKKSKESSK